jgi:hypothetical protein
MKTIAVSLLVTSMLLALACCAPPVADEPGEPQPSQEATGVSQQTPETQPPSRTSEPTPEVEEYGKAQPLVDRAMADLQEQLSISTGQIAVQSVEAVEFEDSSLGVPDPGKVYLRVATPGYIITLTAEGIEYEYHGSGDRVVLASGPEGFDETLPGEYGEAHTLISLAQQNLAERLDIDAGLITVVSVEATEFPNSSLGVPQPGRTYLPVITPGYIIRLEVDGTLYEYHGADDHVILSPGSADGDDTQRHD